MSGLGRSLADLIDSYAAQPILAELLEVTDELQELQERRQRLACSAVAAGAPKRAVAAAAAISRPTLDGWLKASEE